VKNIFIGNLDSTATAASVRSLFEPHGTIQSVKLMTDRETGLSRGFAFVEMMDGEAERAIAALNGSVVSGRAVDVHEGRPKLHLGRAVVERRVPRL
jgi:cold-inducible RNA-binding protein